ncbi:uncharacterized protein LOC126843200 isoform X1 [Adelges cooleyi]|uniref:uncharacterized protein LOC126843200 isoform X1 n=1 Tax=Adelges cooleyi TaxID=133065 RepID=UPI00217F465B|nr:uncharacterized protein LOC126843200 isoform X1 [Adelges cooleyi]
MFYRHYGLNRLTKMFQYILSYSKNITSLNNNNMISHFSLILLCLSGVYCVSSIDYLDLNRLKQIYYRQITGIKEWDEAMKQQIIYEDVNGTRTAVNVKDAVDRFMQKGDNSTVTEFESIRSIIKTAYQCTLVRYATVTAYLIFQELWEHKCNINWALNHTEQNFSNFDLDTIHQNKNFKDIYDSIQWDGNIIDFDVKLGTDDEQIFAVHQFDSKRKQDLHSLWAGFIEKNLGFKINYKIYTEVIKTRFTNQYNIPFIVVLNELACVLNEVIQLLDSFNQDKCVTQDSSFVKSFESLKTGVRGDFMGLLKHFDAMKAREASYDGQHLQYNREGTVPVPFVEGKDLNAKLYRDFTKSIPGKLPAHSEITASGCFVENLQFEISGFKTDIQNTAKPRDIYGPINYGRALELKIKLIETTYYEEKREEKIGMIMFSDKYKPSNDHPESSGHKHNILDQIKDKLTRFQFPKIN